MSVHRMKNKKKALYFFTVQQDRTLRQDHLRCLVQFTGLKYVYIQLAIVINVYIKLFLARIQLNLIRITSYS